MGLLEAHQWKFNVIFPTGFDLHKGFFCKERIGPLQAGKGDQALCMQHQLVIQGVLQNQIAGRPPGCRGWRPEAAPG